MHSVESFGIADLSDHWHLLPLSLVCGRGRPSLLLQPLAKVCGYVGRLLMIVPSPNFVSAPSTESCV